MRTVKARRRGLTRDAVVEAALGIVDAEGLGALTMRRLAGELGVEAMSLYHHVGGKDELVNAMNVAVLSGLDGPTDGLAWPEVLRLFARRLYDAYLPRPDLARTLERTIPASPEAFRAMERVLAALDETGLEPSEQVNAFRGVIAACLGFVIVHAGDRSAPGVPEDGPWAGWDEAAMTGSGLHSIVALAPAFETTSNDADFDFVIGACIAELQRRAAGQACPHETDVHADQDEDMTTT